MSNEKLMNLSIVALVIASIGVTLGIYAIFIPSSETSFKNLYYCSSESSLQNAIDDIGSGNGKIIITRDITLKSTIEINGGGDYIIQGVGSVTIGGAFIITSASSCIIKDLTINGSTLPISVNRIIFVNENSDNPVWIQNVQFLGGSALFGIYIHSNNVWVRDCVFKELTNGVFTYQNEYCYIIHNKFYNNQDAITLSSSLYSKIEGNSIDNCLYGMYLVKSNRTTVTSNLIQNITNIGITLSQVEQNTISGNSILYSNSVPSGTVSGISIDIARCNSFVGNIISNITSSGFVWGISADLASYNSFTGNIIYGITSSGETGFAFFLDSGCQENVVTGNNFYDNDDNSIIDSGSNNEISGNNEG